MSPLIRSLLALAALLVAADAQSNCNEETFGEPSNYPVAQITVSTPPRGGRIDIPDGCSQHYGRYYVAVGVTVTACNNNAYGAAPEIEQVNPPDLTPVDVVCVVDNCLSGAEVDIVQYCAPY